MQKISLPFTHLSGRRRLIISLSVPFCSQAADGHGIFAVCLLCFAPGCRALTPPTLRWTCMRHDRYTSGWSIDCQRQMGGQLALWWRRKHHSVCARSCASPCTAAGWSHRTHHSPCRCWCGALCSADSDLLPDQESETPALHALQHWLLEPLQAACLSPVGVQRRFSPLPVAQAQEPDQAAPGVRGQAAWASARA